ncbi:hypothetical protein APA_1412 [Pseudanabaena sp. lw0831]|uniref:hypothetical protein n=1 Tax=Pseudanabaena sp. lw0831 TaxID=1357935 RepID=UPI001916B3FD|nr:hypothetical protein [Pseudanabaena sp. lw0831]GBO53505.1 hypothetical protein APA_1412 [Pseudanabaena sp. lw0831]
MNVLYFPYFVNIVILVPIAIGTLFNIFPVAGGHFAESEGWRSLVGSLWTAILIGSILGLFHPIAFSPLLLVQVVYKALWLMVYIAPRLIYGDPNHEIHWAISIIFAFIVVLYPLVIPWNYLFKLSA